MQIHQVSASEALARLRSSLAGLDHPEAERRYREYGANRLEQVSKAPPWLRFLRELVNLFSVILWVAAALAFVAEWFAPGQGMVRLAWTVITVILVSGAFSFWQEHRVEQTLAALHKLLPQQVDVLRDNKVSRLERERLVPGDIVLLAQGDYIPADCRLVEGFDVRVNNASITGESLPLVRDAAPCGEKNLLFGKNILLAGTTMVAGQAKALVYATGRRTEFGKIAHLTQSGGEVSSPLHREIAHLSRVIGVCSVCIGLFFFLIGRFVGLPLWDDFIFAIGILIAMVPEGLLPTLTLALVLATQRMAKRNVLIRHLPSVETLGATTVICTDKTGTLTQNRMRVHTVVLGGERVNADGISRFIEDYRPFFLTARLCHDLREGEKNGRTVLSGDPMEIALADLAAEMRTVPAREEKLDEICFDAERMRQSVIYAIDGSPHLYCKGAPEVLFTRCTHFLQGGTARPMTEGDRTHFRQIQESLAEQGMRVLALASRPLSLGWRQQSDLEEELVLAGLAGLEDPPRPEVPEAIDKCHRAGIKVIMVTGDHPSTARAIAREIGLVRSENPLVVSGDMLRGYSETQLRLALDEEDILFARVSADQKMRIVDALKMKQHVVAVTGDGVNDAPALKSAHIGIAMGLTGTDVAKEAADMVLLDDNFASIVSAVEEGRAVFDNIRRFLTYILAHNIPELIPYLAFVLLKIPLALLPIQILLVDMGTDSLTALGLGAEKPDPEVMRRPPRRRHERLFNWPLAWRAYLFLGVFEAMAAMACFFFVLWQGGWQYGQELAMDSKLFMQATTAYLSSIIVMQMVNVFHCRSDHRSLLSTGVTGNPLITAGILLETVLILTVVYTPLGNALFATAPLDASTWLFLLPWAVLFLCLEELRKVVIRKRR